MRRPAVLLLPLALVGCANVRSLPAEEAGPDALRSLQGQAVVVRVRGEGFVRGALGDVGTDSLRLVVGRQTRVWPFADVCAVSSAARQQRGIGKGVLIGAGAGLLLTAYAAGAASSVETEQFPYGAVLIAGAALTIPILALAGGAAGGGTTPATRYVFDARCR